jgi:hypothetical protein
MKQIILLAAILMAILAPTNGFTAELGTLNGAPPQTQSATTTNTSVDVNNVLRVNGRVIRPENTETQTQVVPQVQTNTTPNNVYVVVNPAQNPAQTRNTVSYKTRVVPKYIRTPAPAPKVIVNNIPAPPAASINIIYAAPLEKSSTDAGAAGKEPKTMDLTPIWILSGLALIVGLVITMMILTNAAKQEQINAENRRIAAATEQRQREEREDRLERARAAGTIRQQELNIVGQLMGVAPKPVEGVTDVQLNFPGAGNARFYTNTNTNQARTIVPGEFARRTAPLADAVAVDPNAVI